MQLPPIHTLVSLLLLLAGAPVYGQTQETVRAHHAWGRFKTGAWKQVRLLTETLDEKGNVVSTSTTETKTTLEDVSENEYTLRIEATVEVAGKRFPVPPQVVKQGYNGETEGQKVSNKRVGDSGVTINGQTFASEVREVVVNGGNTKRVSTVHYSEKVPPFVLKRDTRSTDVDGKVTNYQTQVEVIAVNMPYNVLAEVKSAAIIKTIHKQPKHSSITLEFHCDDVPGGVVSHTTKDDDESGRTIRRSTLELLDYGTGSDPAEDDNVLGRRRRFHRTRARTGAAPAERARLE